MWEKCEKRTKQKKTKRRFGEQFRHSVTKTELKTKVMEKLYFLFQSLNSDLL